MTLNFGMQHWVLEYYQFYSDDDPGMTWTYFMARSNLIPYAFVWEKGKTMDFYEIKVGRCSQPNEYMNLYDYQWSRSFIDFGPRSLRFNILNFFSLETDRLVEAKFHGAPPWNGEWKLISNGLCHMAKLDAIPIYGKNLHWPWSITQIQYF